MENKIIQGDCLEKLKELLDNSVDSIVTDPPAGISFMGKEWDNNKGGRDNWVKWMSDVATECKRVLKPGGHAFVWAIPRTSHWTATAWENAGFEIRDVVAHIFGSGFPKSLNIGKAVDKLQGNEREIVGENPNKKGRTYDSKGGFGSATLTDNGINHGVFNTKGTSEWEGWGTALKPAREDWILMRKPTEKGLSIAENCLKWGTGGINIDESRVGTDTISIHNAPKGTFAGGEPDRGSDTESYRESVGRFPANLLTDGSEEVRECFPETKGDSRTSKPTYDKGMWGNAKSVESNALYSDSGNASRFFKSIVYVPKASKNERNRGCEGLEEKPIALNTGEAHNVATLGRETKYTNNHPTVKPIALMEYLIKMVTPKGGIVLDPFAGSGSTLVAAKQNGFQYIGIELTEEYIPIIQARLETTKTENTLF